VAAGQRAVASVPATLHLRAGRQREAPLQALAAGDLVVDLECARLAVEGHPAAMDDRVEALVLAGEQRPWAVGLPVTARALARPPARTGSRCAAGSARAPSILQRGVRGGRAEGVARGGIGRVDVGAGIDDERLAPRHSSNESWSLWAWAPTPPRPTSPQRTIAQSARGA
jgi:hypothetical protein